MRKSRKKTNDKKSEVEAKLKGKQRADDNTKTAERTAGSSEKKTSPVLISETEAVTNAPQSTSKVEESTGSKAGAGCSGKVFQRTLSGTSSVF